MIQKDFKLSKAGEIPKEWDSMPLLELFDFGNGYTPSKADSAFWINGTIPWFRVEDIRINGHILNDAIQKITPLAVKGDLFPKNSFIISTSATIGEYAYVTKPYLANQRFVCLIKRATANQLLDDGYFLCLCESLGQWCRDNCDQGSSFPSVNMQSFRNHHIPLPPLAEQKKIAKALSDVDALINYLDGLIAKKRDIKQGTMQQLLTGKKRLPGYTDKWKSSAMWELTAWDKFFSEVEKGKQKKVIRYPYILAANMEAMEQANGNVYLLATGNYEGWTTEEIAGSYLCEGEVVSIPWGGYANIKYTKGKFVTADNRIATSLDTSILDNKYLYYYMLQNKKTFDSFYRGAGIQHPSMADVLDFEILYPSINEQRAIATVLTDMDNEIQALEAKRDKYTAIKQGMMQELLTGKIRLV